MKREQDKKEGGMLGGVVERFRGKKVCVIGDIIADVYIFGKPYRLSREAPVVIVKFEESRIFPGSAGNTINNLLALGAYVCPLGFIGSDNAGKKLMKYFSQHKNIDTGGIIRHDGETVTKTRILAGDTHTSKQQVIRIDKDSNRPVSRSERSTLMKKLKATAPSVDAFIVSDYGHGTIDEEIIDFMKNIAKRKIVVGDSRYGLEMFKGFTIITPNESEAYRLSGFDDDQDINRVGRTIMGKMRLKALLITRGNKGMRLFVGSRKIYDIPISGTDDVADVTGAGDTVCATIALSLAGGADFYTASRIANYAAGIVVMKRGTATVTVQELEKAIGNQGELQ
ncbi:MAG TPA: bifunctional ADP-heptose synthase [Syntrophorhabdaceae bacterium]|nr:bifunctional ADP-heptose synthase [Syntrophorhabdaceae bacterium]HQM80840.1 bifunctional ADP-heptose synthase [Syntrophorhabdaceae bacterium]